MSKSISSGMNTHRQLTVTSLASMFKITRRDGTSFYFTDHDKNLDFDGQTYLAASGFMRTAIQNDSSLAVDNLEVQGVFDSSSITVEDIRAGLFDYAEVWFFKVNWQDLTDLDVKLKRGYLGEVVAGSVGVFVAELRSLVQLLSQDIVELYQPECRADLGDSRCGMPIKPSDVARNTAYAVGDYVTVETDTGATGQAKHENRIYQCTTAGTTAGSAPTYDTVVGNTTSDGTAVFTAEEAWTRHGVVATVTSNSVFTLTITESRAVDDWFNGGALTFETGNNAGITIEVRDWVNSTSSVTLFLTAPYDVQVGDLVRIYPGCDKRDATCSGRFSNILNFRGEPFVPGERFLTTYPDAK